MGSIENQQFTPGNDKIAPFTADELLPSISCHVISAKTKGSDRVIVVMVLKDQEEPQELEFSVDYLRISCECTDCFNPSSLSYSVLFEHFLETFTVHEISVKDGGLEVMFSDDHKSYYPALWLYRRRFTEEGKTERMNAIHFDNQVAWCENYQVQSGSYKEICEEPEGFIKFGDTMTRDGIYVITDCPDQQISLPEFLDKAALVPFLTQYGSDFNVRNVPKPLNLAYTARKLELHIDLPFVSYTPRIQLLRCLQQAEVGGENIMSDGIKAANLLRKRHPDMFHTLKTQKINFEDLFPVTTASCKHVGYYANRKPVINVDEEGNPAFILWNPMVRSSLFNDGLDHFENWIKAMRVFYKICYECSITIKTKSGETLIFDNRRVMHSRLAYNTQEARHLDGCYTDWDHVHSRLRIAKIQLAQQQKKKTSNGTPE